jgi:hypothetical protein
MKTSIPYKKAIRDEFGEAMQDIGLQSEIPRLADAARRHGRRAAEILSLLPGQLWIEMHSGNQSGGE